MIELERIMASSTGGDFLHYEPSDDLYFSIQEIVVLGINIRPLLSELRDAVPDNEVQQSVFASFITKMQQMKAHATRVWTMIEALLSNINVFYVIAIEEQEECNEASDLDLRLADFVKNVIKDRLQSLQTRISLFEKSIPQLDIGPFEQLRLCYGLPERRWRVQRLINSTRWSIESLTAAELMSSRNNSEEIIFP